MVTMATRLSDSGTMITAFFFNKTAKRATTQQEYLSVIQEGLSCQLLMST